jgi:hypothetical protein
MLAPRALWTKGTLARKSKNWGTSGIFSQFVGALQLGESKPSLHGDASFSR